MQLFISKQNVPIYVLVLFVIAFFVLFYIILTWMFSTTTTNTMGVEGFTNPQYNYLPSNRSPNSSIKFGLSDLAVDISFACGFIKTDSKLNYGNGSQTTTMSPSQTTTPSQKSSAGTSESFSTNEDGANTAASSPSTTASSLETAAPTTAATTMSPYDANLSNEPTNSPTTPAPINETQPPFPTSASNLNSNINGDYTVPYTQLQIYKLYNITTGYSSTGNDNTYKIMDMSYGRFFDATQLGKLTDENVAKLWNENASIIIDDTIYNGSNYFVIQSGLNNRKCASSGKAWPGLSSYFLQQILKNKSSNSGLLSLKNAYYAIIRPRFLLNTLSNAYWQNVQTITNSDKGTQDSIVFVLNTFANLSGINTLKEDLEAEGVAKIILDDSPFTIDSLWLYQLMSISFELYRYIAYFKEYGSATTSSGNPAITTTASVFISGYPMYLQKINQVSPESPLVFLLKNPPSKTECPVVDKLAPYFGNISG